MQLGPRMDANEREFPRRVGGSNHEPLAEPFGAGIFKVLLRGFHARGFASVRGPTA
jgi:hypothetical protein